MTTAPAPATSLTAAEEARAAEIEAQIVAQERTAASAADRSRSRRADADADAAPRGRTKEGVLASRATLEYAYVSADLRRIGVVAGALLVLMIAIWVVLSLSGALKL